MAAMLKLSPPDAGIAFSLSGKARLAQRLARINSKTPAPKTIRRFFGNFTLLDVIEKISVHSSILKWILILSRCSALGSQNAFRDAAHIRMGAEESSSVDCASNRYGDHIFSGVRPSSPGWARARLGTVPGVWSGNVTA